MLYAVLALALVSFLLSAILTRGMIWLSPKIGFVDKPGHRKIHTNPKPLGGGVAMFWGFAIPLIGIVVAPTLLTQIGWIENSQAYLGGVQRRSAQAIGLLLAMFAMHILGLIDDRRALGPFIKLFIQLTITATLVTWFDLRALTALDNLGLGRTPSIVVTVLWIGAITNAFNFLDNMDGLSAGVAAVCTTAFLITALSIGQWFVAGSLALLLGSLLGFLVWNFPPAKIFMGDSGSLLIGLVLGVLTVRTTYLPSNVSFNAGWYAILAPVIVLALPLYDLIVVSIIRLLNGKSPFVGDTNHFSHRLVRRGMSKRTAVLCLYLITAATSIAAILLPHVQSSWGAILIFCQTILILGVVALLEQHPLPPASEG
jgi:UDP-GlcNAc:undecaprenyl-phosphate GlcNAc-1-phosphate transferase